MNCKMIDCKDCVNAETKRTKFPCSICCRPDNHFKSKYPALGIHRPCVECSNAVDGRNTHNMPCSKCNHDGRWKTSNTVNNFTPINIEPKTDKKYNKTPRCRTCKFGMENNSTGKLCNKNGIGMCGEGGNINKTWYEEYIKPKPSNLKNCSTCDNTIAITGKYCKYGIQCAFDGHNMWQPRRSDKYKKPNKVKQLRRCSECVYEVKGEKYCSYKYNQVPNGEKRFHYDSCGFKQKVLKSDVKLKWYTAGMDLKNGDRVYISCINPDLVYKSFNNNNTHIVDCQPETLKGGLVRIRPLDFVDTIASTAKIIKESMKKTDYLVMSDLNIARNKTFMKGIVKNEVKKEMETLKEIQKRIKDEKKKRENITGKLYLYIDDRDIFKLKRGELTYTERYLFQKEFIEFLDLTRSLRNMLKDCRIRYYGGKLEYKKVNYLKLDNTTWNDLEYAFTYVINGIEPYKIKKAKQELCELTDCYKDKAKKIRRKVALKVCENCGEENLIEAKFCSDCGLLF